MKKHVHPSLLCQIRSHCKRHKGAVPARAFASDIDAGAADSDAAAAAADLEYRPRNSSIWRADHQIQ